MSNDFPPGVRILTDDEIKGFPQTEDPGPPDHAQNDKLKKQLDDEKIHGHPALKAHYDGD